ncbi:TPA: hypothetical protein ACKPZT_002662, partial [Stenotrophomonas maltophilia]
MASTHGREKEEQEQKQKRPFGRFFHARRTHERSDPLLPLIFFFLLRGLAAHGTCQGPGGL